MELETEFDRYLQQLDGKVLPQDRHVSQYFRLTRGEQATVSGFYNEVSPGAIGWCSRNMARVYRIITSRRRKTARFLLSLGEAAPCGRYPVGQQEIHEHEALGGGSVRRLYCRLTSGLPEPANKFAHKS